MTSWRRKLVVVSVFVGSVAMIAASSRAQQPAPEAQKDTYAWPQAAEDARRYNESEQRAAVERQIEQQNAIRARLAWAPYAYSWPYGYGVYGYGRAWRGMRTHRALESLGSPYYVFTPWAYAPGAVYGSPYLGGTRQPIGHEKIWTGPNSYIYRPKYADEASPAAPPESGPAPAVPASPAPPAAPWSPPPPPTPQLPTVLPGPLVPEMLPLPPPVLDGPQEF